MSERRLGPTQMAKLDNPERRKALQPEGAGNTGEWI